MYVCGLYRVRKETAIKAFLVFLLVFMYRYLDTHRISSSLCLIECIRIWSKFSQFYPVILVARPQGISKEDTDHWRFCFRMDVKFHNLRVNK